MFYFLILAILFSAITHVALSFKKYVPYLQSQIDEYTIQNPVNEGLRLAIISFLIGFPIFLFSTLKSWHIESNLINYILLVVILIISVLSIFFSEKYLWSDKFEANIKPRKSTNSIKKTILEVKNSFIKEVNTLSNKIENLNNIVIKQEQLQEKSSKNIYQNLNKIEQNRGEIDDINKYVQSTLNKKQKDSPIKDFKTFFRYPETFSETITLLTKNDFFPKNRKLTPIEINILLLKLEKNKLLKHRITQKYLVKSAQKYFKVTPYGEENYSRLKKSYENDSFVQLNQKRFDTLYYLDSILNQKKISQ